MRESEELFNFPHLLHDGDDDKKVKKSVMMREWKFNFICWREKARIRWIMSFSCYRKRCCLITMAGFKELQNIVPACFLVWEVFPHSNNHADENGRKKLNSELNVAILAGLLVIVEAKNSRLRSPRGSWLVGQAVSNGNLRTCWLMQFRRLQLLCVVDNNAHMKSLIYSLRQTHLAKILKLSIIGSFSRIFTS